MYILPFSVYFFLFFDLFLSLASPAAGAFATFTSPHLLSISGVGLFQMVGRYCGSSLAKYLLGWNALRNSNHPSFTIYPLKQHSREKTPTETVNFDKQYSNIASPYSCEWEQGTKAQKNVASVGSLHFFCCSNEQLQLISCYAWKMLK